MAGDLRELVVLDTSAARAVIHDDASAARWAEARDLLGRFRFCLMDVCFGELWAAMEDGGPVWTDWLRRRGVLSAGLDSRRPIVLRASVPGIDVSSPAELAETENSLTTFYQILLRTSRPEEVFDFQVTMLNGTPAEYPRDSAKEAIERNRIFYIDLLEKMEAHRQELGVAATQDEIASAFLAGLPPDRRAGADGWVRATARFISLLPRGYSPRSAGRTGDAVDIMLLVALEMPAYVLTEERRLREHLRAAGATRRDRVLSIHEFFDRAGRDALPGLNR